MGMGWGNLESLGGHGMGESRVSGWAWDDRVSGWCGMGNVCSTNISFM